MNWSSGLLVYLPSVYSPVRIYLFGITFHNQPSTHSLLSPAYISIPRFLEEHAEAIERHRLLDGAFDDEFVADLGGGHERAIALGGDVIHIRRRDVPPVLCTLYFVTLYFVTLYLKWFPTTKLLLFFDMSDHNGIEKKEKKIPVRLHICKICCTFAAANN